MLPALDLLPSWWSVMSIGFGAIWQTVLAHVVPLSLAGVVLAVILVAVLVPGGLGLVRTALGVVAKFLLGTAAGRAVLLGLACLVVGWEARAVLDRSITLRQQFEAQIQATDAEKAAAAAAIAAAAQEHQQAIAMRDLGAEATKRAEAAEAQGQDLQDQVDDYADQISAAASATKPACSRALTAADVAALNRIGAATAAKP